MRTMNSVDCLATGAAIQAAFHHPAINTTNYILENNALGCFPWDQQKRVILVCNE